MNTDTAVPQVLPGGISHNLKPAVLQAVHNLALRQAGHGASLSSAAGWAQCSLSPCKGHLTTYSHVPSGGPAELWPGTTLI